MSSDDREYTLLETGPSHLSRSGSYTLLPLLGAALVAGCFALAHWVGRTHPSAPERLILTLRLYVPTLALIVIGARLWWVWASVAFTRYIITNERLIVTSGVFDQLTEETELRRVRDMAVQKPFDLRVVGLGHVEVIAADPTDPVTILQAIPHPDDVKEMLRKAVADAWQKAGVHEVVMNRINDHGLDHSQPNIHF